MLNKALRLGEFYCEKCRIDWKFIKFLFVGGLNTLYGYGIFALLILCRIPYPIANFLSILSGIVFNFFTTGRLVFSNRNNRLFWRFGIVYGFNWAFSTAVMYLSNWLGYGNMYIVGLALILPNAAISFLLMKYFVFNEVKHEKN